LKCCGYGLDGKQISGYDCVIIPGAISIAAAAIDVPNQFCGDIGLYKVAATATTICSKLD
jgi:hypothetical protein